MRIERMCKMSSDLYKIGKEAYLNINKRLLNDFSDVLLPDDIRENEIEILCKISREFFRKMYYDEDYNTVEYKRLFECIGKKDSIKLSDVLGVYERVFKPYSDFFNNLDRELLNEFFDGYKCSHLYNFNGDVGDDIKRFKEIWSLERYKIVKERLMCDIDDEFYSYLEDNNYHSYDSYSMLERYEILCEFME